MRSRQKKNASFINAVKFRVRPWGPKGEQKRALPQGADIPVGGDRKKSTNKQTTQQVAIRAIEKMREK